jgi:hypothetical protein
MENLSTTLYLLFQNYSVALSLHKNTNPLTKDVAN